MAQNTKCSKCGIIIPDNSTQCTNCLKTRNYRKLAKLSPHQPPKKVPKKETKAKKNYYIECFPFPAQTLHKNLVFKIGREDNNDLVLPSHEVSRYHASIKWEKNSFVIEDLNSSNGMYFVDERIEKRVLENNNVIVIGAYNIVYSEAAKSNVTHEDIAKGAAKKTLQISTSDLLQRSLEGSIESLGLFGIFQLLSSEARTGRFKIVSEGDIAYVYFNEGIIYHCTCRQFSGQDAFFELMKWREGKFRFDDSENTDEKTMQGDVEYLLIESARRLDEEE